VTVRDTPNDDEHEEERPMGQRMQGSVDTGGATLRFRFDGPDAAPCVVLLSSLGATFEMWEPQVPRLAGFCRVLRLDHRGHGGSPAPAGPYTIGDLGRDVVGALDSLGVERAAFCGISLGGMVAMWVAAHHPERTTSLVLACTAPQLGPADAWVERAARARTTGTGALLDGLYERWFPAEVRKERPELRAEVASMVTSTDDEGYASCCEAIATMDLRPDLPRIQAPALVIAGAEDPVTPPATELALAQALGAGLVVLPGAGHVANLAATEEFTEAVVTHLVGLPAVRGAAARRAVLGDEHVTTSMQTPDPAARALVDYLTRAGWAEVWSRPGLDRRTRSAITLACLVALGRPGELEIHVAGALRNGLSAEEVTEIVLHCAAYAGMPAAKAAMPLVLRALDDASPG
jgi:3-oxoadipate enol-lactonase/4-carboxymuconolactone decarboxylase